MPVIAPLPVCFKFASFCHHDPKFDTWFWITWLHPELSVRISFHLVGFVSLCLKCDKENFKLNKTPPFISAAVNLCTVGSRWRRINRTNHVQCFVGMDGLYIILSQSAPVQNMWRKSAPCCTVCSTDEVHTIPFKYLNAWRPYYKLLASEFWCWKTNPIFESLLCPRDVYPIVFTCHIFIGFLIGRVFTCRSHVLPVLFVLFLYPHF